ESQASRKINGAAPGRPVSSSRVNDNFAVQEGHWTDWKGRRLVIVDPRRVGRNRRGVGNRDRAITAGGASERGRRTDFLRVDLSSLSLLRHRRAWRRTDTKDEGGEPRDGQRSECPQACNSRHGENTSCFYSGNRRQKVHPRSELILATILSRHEPRRA